MDSNNSIQTTIYIHHHPITVDVYSKPNHQHTVIIFPALGIAIQKYQKLTSLLVDHHFNVIAADYPHCGRNTPVVSEETLKRINNEIPINSKYLKQGIAVMGTLSAKYHPNFEDNVYLEFCDKLFKTSLNNIKDRKTAKRIIKEIKDIYGVNVPDSIPETYALYHIYEALVPKTSKGYGYDKIQHFVYNVNSQFNDGYLPTKVAQLGGEAIDIIKGKFSEEIRIDSGNDMDANNNGLAYGEKLSKRYDESIPFRDKK